MNSQSFVRFLIVTLILVLSFSVSVVSEEKIHFHGYGELHYNNTDKPGGQDKMDYHRLVLGWTYSFNTRIKLNVEIDFEHAAKEMELEFAFVDYLITDSFNLRAGSLLMPIGYLNEFHEPPLFYSVERPYVQKYVIPTTWQEGGAGIFGILNKDIRYRVYLVNGLDASNFKSDSGIRSGRHKVAESPSENLALTGRVEYGGIKNLQLGLSGYSGNAGQDAAGIGDAAVTLFEGDVRYSIKELELTGLFSQVTIGDSDKINAVTDNGVGKTIQGSFVEAGYHLGSHFLPDENDLVVFVRRELINTHEEVAPGLSVDPKNERNITTVGAAFYPIKEVVFKADLESWKDGNDDTWSQFNIGVGYMY